MSGCPVLAFFARASGDAIGPMGPFRRDLEEVVLSRAVAWHVETRVLVYGNKTVVF